MVQVLLFLVDIGAVSISSSGSSTAGETYSLTCSATISPNPLPTNVPSPTFQWFFGPNNSSLPSGVTPSNTTITGNTYTSTLEFSRLSQRHTGMYTCRIGAGKLANYAMVTINGRIRYIYSVHIMCFSMQILLQYSVHSLSAWACRHAPACACCKKQ